MMAPVRELVGWIHVHDDEFVPCAINPPPSNLDPAERQYRIYTDLWRSRTRLIAFKVCPDKLASQGGSVPLR